jgi:hypothetical protein
MRAAVLAFRLCCVLRALPFTAIADDPEPEVAAAGHDQTIINIKPEHVGAGLNSDPADLAALYRIFDDKRHPFYEHRLTA